MKKINLLIFGLMDTVGGIESFILDILRNMPLVEFNIDFLAKGVTSITYQEEIRKLLPGTRFYFVPKYSQNPIKCAISLRKILKGNRYDIIYMNSGFSSDMLFIAPYVGKNTKIIMHSHMSHSDISSWRTVLFRWYANRHADLRFACSYNAAKWLFGQKEAEKGNIKIINNGINTDKYTFSSKDRNEIRTELGLDDDSILIGHIGRFVPTKNHKYILEIFKKLAEVHSNVYLIFLGDGPLRGEINGIIQEVGLEKQVIMTGVKKDIWRYYSALDVFVLPSVHEGFPVTGVEAQSMGLPCLFSDHIDKSILITDRAKALPIEPGSIDEWKTEIISLSDCPVDERKKYSSIVRKYGFDIRDVATEIRNYLYELQ